MEGSTGEWVEMQHETVLGQWCDCHSHLQDWKEKTLADLEGFFLPLTLKTSLMHRLRLKGITNCSILSTLLSSASSDLSTFLSIFSQEALILVFLSKL